MAARNRTATILITRPEPAASALARELGAVTGPDRILVSPVLRIAPADAPADLTGIRTLIFTSREGVRAFVRAHPGCRLPALTVGEQTARDARQAGLGARCLGADARGFLDRFTPGDAPGPCLYIRGAHASVDLAAALSARGVPTRAAILYRQAAQPLDPAARQVLSSPAPVVLPLYSARSAGVFFRQGPFHAPLYVVAISEKVAKTVPDVTACVTADNPDGKSMQERTLGLWNALNRLEGGTPGL